MRFLLGANADFKAATDLVPLEKMTPIDRWALSRLYDLNKRVTEAYDTYSFNKVYHALNLFFTVDLSATYLDVLKDRLYTWKGDGLARRSAQTVIHHMNSYLIRMMAPILSFLAEETYTYLSEEQKAASVFLSDFPVAPEAWKNPTLAASFDELLKVRSDVQKNLEELRAAKTIGASLEAKVTVTAQNETLKALKDLDGPGGLSSDLREFFIVSEVSLVDGPYSVKAEKAGGEKCVRCWVYVPNINSSSQFPGVCPKCVEALS
jgi:isoleucyl-tRNA synthetase